MWSTVRAVESVQSRQLLLLHPENTENPPQNMLHRCVVMASPGTLQLLDAAMSGFNVTVLVYGQTGSGKTFTMLGREEVIDGDGYVGELWKCRRCMHFVTYCSS